MEDGEMEKKAMQEFEKYSESMQNLHFQLIEGKEYDVLRSTELCYFSRILRNYIPIEGKAEELSKKITCSRNLYYRIVIVNCYADGNIFSVPVIRVKQREGQDVFYDIESRKYKDWEDFLSSNKLPKCLMMFPDNGTYKAENGKLTLTKRDSPACSIGNILHQGALIVAKVVSSVAPVVANSEFLKPYNKVILCLASFANAYTSGDNIYQLYDHAKHDNSIQFSDEKAAFHYISIAKNILLFGFTLAKVKFDSPQFNELVINNLLLMCKEINKDNNDLASKLATIQTFVLCHHMTYFTDKAVEFFQNEVRCDHFNGHELICILRSYILQNESVKSKFRLFVKADEIALSTVARDLAFAREIPRLFKMELYNLNIKCSEIVDKIMQEIKMWANGKASLMQLMFRVTGVCLGLKRYETLEEMCKHFNVSQPVDIQIKNKYLFEGSRRKLLEFYSSFDIEKFPQLLSYMVDYLTNDGNGDLQYFKKYLNERLAKEMNMSIAQQAIIPDKEWINALTLETLSYVHSVPHDGINLVKLKTEHETEVTLGDLYKLAKRLLGRVGDIDMKLLRPDVDWVIVALKRRRVAVIIGPKITLDNYPSVGICYPVFKRYF